MRLGGGSSAGCFVVGLGFEDRLVTRQQARRLLAPAGGAEFLAEFGVGIDQLRPTGLPGRGCRVGL